MIRGATNRNGRREIISTQIPVPIHPNKNNARHTHLPLNDERFFFSRIPFASRNNWKKLHFFFVNVRQNCFWILHQRLRRDSSGSCRIRIIVTIDLKVEGALIITLLHRRSSSEIFYGFNPQTVEIQHILQYILFWKERKIVARLSAINWPFERWIRANVQIVCVRFSRSISFNLAAVFRLRFNGSWLQNMAWSALCAVRGRHLMCWQQQEDAVLDFERQLQAVPRLWLWKWTESSVVKGFEWAYNVIFGSG